MKEIIEELVQSFATIHYNLYSLDVASLTMLTLNEKKCVLRMRAEINVMLTSLHSRLYSEYDVYESYQIGQNYLAKCTIMKALEDEFLSEDEIETIVNTLLEIG